MKPSEFDRWLRYHRAAFPDLARWLTEKGSPETLAIWREVLKGTQLKHAIEASLALLEGSGERPWGYTDHPRWIKSYAHRKWLHETYGQQQDEVNLPPCDRCNLTGMVRIWHPAAVRRAQVGEPPNRLMLSCVAACNKCFRGSILAMRQRVRRATDQDIPCEDVSYPGQLLEALGITDYPWADQLTPEGRLAVGSTLIDDLLTEEDPCDE